MGAVGYSIFEDDLGADWVAEFLKTPSIETVRQILDMNRSSEYLDDIAASATLCCIEIVAAGLGKPTPTIPYDLNKWAQSVAMDLAQLKGRAFNATEIVKENSELKEIWQEDPKWIAYLLDLKKRVTI